MAARGQGRGFDGSDSYDPYALDPDRDKAPDFPERSAAQDRLHGKYHGLRRTSDDSVVEGWYFVIRESDEAGKAALLAYADACEGYAPELAADLRQRVRGERLMDGLYEAGWER